MRPSHLATVEARKRLTSTSLPSVSLPSALTENAPRSPLRWLWTPQPRAETLRRLMRNFFARLFKWRARKPKPPALFASYVSHYNGQMNTMSGRDSLRNHTYYDR